MKESKMKEEARASFRANEIRLSDPVVQASIEDEAQRQMTEWLAGFNEFMARSQALGGNEFLR